MERRHPQVVNISDVESRSIGNGKKFVAKAKSLGVAVGARAIGCSWYELPPGHAAFPHHFHCVREESLFVLEGEGTLRIGEQKVAVRAGDYVAFPVGPESAHQLQNTGSAPLRYLCFSTQSTGEVVGYPDSKKIGVLGAGSPEAAAKGQHWVRLLTFESSSVGYYDGEDEE